MPQPSATNSWSALNERRRAIRRRWRSVWRLPLTARSTRYALERIPPGAVVVDVGASGGGFGTKLPPGVRYVTVDVDPLVGADHASLRELPAASADVVTAFEMIEHLTLEEAWGFLTEAFRVLRPGGGLFLSTPNVYAPWAWQQSCTHKTPFCYDELGGLAEMAGFSVTAILRCHHDSAFKAIVRFLARPLQRLVGVDWAESIVLHAARPRKSTGGEN